MAIWLDFFFSFLFSSFSTLAMLFFFFHFFQGASTGTRGEPWFFSLLFSFGGKWQIWGWVGLVPMAFSFRFLSLSSSFRFLFSFPLNPFLARGIYIYMYMYVYIHDVLATGTSRRKENHANRCSFSYGCLLTSFTNVPTLFFFFQRMCVCVCALRSRTRSKSCVLAHNK